MKKALYFIILLGIVSLFADITYEGGRSITGQYLAELGASGAIVGFVAGFGELLGYTLRVLSGKLADKTKRYWTFIFLGYAVNVFAVPFLSLAYTWQVAALFIILERAGKAIRNPARDAMLSYAVKETGRGFGFGLHELLDQFGAVIGPLSIALILTFQGSYRTSFAYLLFPALTCIAVLTYARKKYPDPRELDIEVSKGPSKGFSKRFFIYMAAMACVAMGYVDFALIAFHLQKSSVMPLTWIPLFYAVAMAAEGLSALILGRFFDLYGERVLIVSTFFALFFVPCVFLGTTPWIFLGLLLWGGGMGAQTSIMSAVVANLIRAEERATAYGLFNLIFGMAWFLGSALMGWLYDRSLVELMLFSCLSQALALPILFYLTRSSSIK